MVLSHDRIFHRQCTELVALKYGTQSVELSHDDDSKPFFLTESIPTLYRANTDSVPTT